MGSILVLSNIQFVQLNQNITFQYHQIFTSPQQYCAVKTNKIIHNTPLSLVSSYRFCVFTVCKHLNLCSATTTKGKSISTVPCIQHHLKMLQIWSFMDTYSYCNNAVIPQYCNNNTLLCMKYQYHSTLVHITSHHATSY